MFPEAFPIRYVDPVYRPPSEPDAQMPPLRRPLAQLRAAIARPEDTRLRPT